MSVVRNTEPEETLPCDVLRGWATDAVVKIAARQRGVVTRTQLRDVGLSEDMITYRARIGSLHRLHRGVFLVGHPVPPPLARETALFWRAARARCSATTPPRPSGASARRGTESST